MAKTATGERLQDYWAVDVWSETTGTRRFIAKDEPAAIDTQTRFETAFSDEKVSTIRQHVRSYR